MRGENITVVSCGIQLPLKAMNHDDDDVVMEMMKVKIWRSYIYLLFLAFIGRKMRKLRVMILAILDDFSHT